MQAALRKAQGSHRTEDDAKVMLNKLKNELDYLHNGFDTVTDPVMIDSLIYEIMSVNMKYKFFLNKCRTPAGD